MHLGREQLRKGGAGCLSHEQQQRNRVSAASRMKKIMQRNSVALCTIVLVAAVGFGSGREVDQESVEQLLGMQQDGSAPRAIDIPASQLPLSVLHFCRKAAPECYFRRGQATPQAAPQAASTVKKSSPAQKPAVVKAAKQPSFPMRSRAEARKSFLHRLKSRLSTLEGDLKHVRERGHGRRLLEFSSRIPDEFAAFPGHFYKVFGGLSQLETASTTVLKHVEDRICTVYDRFCSSLSQTALELGKQEAAAPQPQQPAQEEEQQAADPAMQQPAESLGPGGEEVRRVRKVARPPLTKAQIAEEIEMMREGKWGERLEKNNGKVVSVHETEPSDPAEVEAEKERKEMAQERELRAQKKRREEAKLKKVRAAACLEGGVWDRLCL